MTALNDTFEIIVNGQVISFPIDKPLIANKIRDEVYIYVPLDFCSETLGARVEWEEIGKTLAIHRDGQSVKMRFGDNLAEINDEKIWIGDNLAEIEEGVAFLNYPLPWLRIEEGNIYVLLQMFSRFQGMTIKWEPGGKLLISDATVLALESRPASIINGSIKERAGQEKDILYEEVSRLIDNSGLDRVKEDIKGYLMESVRIRPKRCEEGNIRIGESKIAGIPDLPFTMEWPSVKGRPLSFIAQLNMEELADILPQNELLPAKGWLYFFYDNEEQPWGYQPEHREQWEVLSFDGDPALLERRAFPAMLPDYCRFMPYRLQLAREICIPSIWSLYYQTLKLGWQEQELYRKLEQEIVRLYGDRDEFAPVYRVMGHPGIIQHDMQLECQQVCNGFEPYNFNDPKVAKEYGKAWDWILLMQVDSDESNNGMMWGDCGRLYFWIPRQALREKDFQQVWTILQCY
ncbi:DUF1963 domain-containing protein [Syntrophomonas wolfei]|nr:DUF1963 domain-containing protein [Syntrophomonas wolfei]